MNIRITEVPEQYFSYPEHVQYPVYNPASLTGPLWKESRTPALQAADPKNILGSGTLHPELARRVERLIERASQYGMNLYLFEGHRSMEKQAELYNSGRGVTKAKPGFSYHNFGLAIDIVFRNEKGQPSWSESHNWNLLGQLGKAEGLYWGGDWTSFKDRPHFQLLPNASLPVIRKIYQSSNLQNVWSSIR